MASKAMWEVDPETRSKVRASMSSLLVSNSVLVAHWINWLANI